MNKSLMAAGLALGVLASAGANAATVSLTADGVAKSFSGGDVLTAVGIVDNLPSLTGVFKAIATERVSLTLGSFSVDQSQFTGAPQSLSYAVDDVLVGPLTASYSNSAGILAWELPDLILNAGQVLTVIYSVSSAKGFVSDFNLGYETAPAPVPVPAAGLLLVGALGSMAALRRRKNAA